MLLFLQSQALFNIHRAWLSSCPCPFRAQPHGSAGRTGGTHQRGQACLSPPCCCHRGQWLVPFSSSPVAETGPHSPSALMSKRGRGKVMGSTLRRLSGSKRHEQTRLLHCCPCTTDLPAGLAGLLQRAPRNTCFIQKISPYKAAPAKC